MKLTPNFTMEEMTNSFVGARSGLNNTPPATIIPNIQKCAEMMEAVRSQLDKPILIHSCYRSSAINKLVGGKPNSMHLQGLAVDFVAPAFGTPVQIANALIASDVQFGKLLYEFGDSPSGGWIHIQPGTERKVFTINEHGTFTGIRQ